LTGAARRRIEPNGYLTEWFSFMQADPLSATFAALADPTRRAILARLARGETSVTELAEPFAMSMPAVSKHLKVLERAGLIARGREAQWRPCRIEARALKPVDDWLDSYRRLWEERFDRLDDYLRELQAQESAPSRRKEPGRRKVKRRGRKP
jgi:DNA-binding transcriptional ArsR family regulator